MLYELRLVVGLTDTVQIEADSEDEAIQILEEDFYNGSIMGGDIANSEYFDGIIDIFAEEIEDNEDGDNDINE